MKNILRVSSYPTIEKPGMGLHPSKLCGLEGFFTYYLTPKENKKRLYKPKNTQLINKYFILESRPQNADLLKKLLFTLKRLISILLFSFEGIKILLFKRIDIVHIHSPMYILIAFFGYILKKDIYITFHGTDFHRIENKKWYKLFSNIFKAVFIISPDMKSYLSEIHGNSKIIQVNNGIDTNIYINLKKNRKKQIIAVGSLKKEKGFLFLINAFSDLVNENENYKDYKLIIAGEGLLKNRLQEEIQLNKTEKNIILVGHKDRDSIIKLYNESELYVLSSISEGFPKVILEAMSCGCKIVSTDVGSINDIFRNTEFNVVRPGEKTELKEAIIKALTVKNINYQDILKYYTWQKVQNRYIEIYNGDKK